MKKTKCVVMSPHEMENIINDYEDLRFRAMGVFYREDARCIQFLLDTVDVVEIPISDYLDKRSMNFDDVRIDSDGKFVYFGEYIIDVDRVVREYNRDNE